MFTLIQDYFMCDKERSRSKPINLSEHLNKYVDSSDSMKAQLYQRRQMNKVGNSIKSSKDI